MKANELRIGNLLRDKVSKTELKVIELTEENVISYVIDRSKFPLQKGWGLEPIPLTREWLIKFKFEELEKDCRTFFKKGKFKVELSNGGNVYYNRNIFISSVHQLQNLYFALTGKELTFKSE